MSLQYVVGDATQPIGEGAKMIIHICNDMGGWGRGFVLALSARWKEPEEQYRQWANLTTLSLGEIQVVPVADDLEVVNMIAQHGIFSNKEGLPPIRYDAVETCLEKVATVAMKRQASIHAPRFGAGLASGRANGYDADAWEKIEILLMKILVDKKIEVVIYDLPHTNIATGYIKT